MGLKRWNKILAALLCFSMAFSEPSTMVLASPVVEESEALSDTALMDMVFSDTPSSDTLAVDTSISESNMLKKQFEGADKDTLQISPGHLGYFFYHHVDDELGGTAGASSHPIIVIA